MRDPGPELSSLPGPWGATPHRSFRLRVSAPDEPREPDPAAGANRAIARGRWKPERRREWLPPLDAFRGIARRSPRSAMPTTGSPAREPGPIRVDVCEPRPDLSRPRP